VLRGNTKLPGGPGKTGISAAEYIGLLGVLATEIIIFSFWEKSFFTSRTFFSIAEAIPDTVIVAVGMTFVLIIAGIDLSVGSVLALSQAVLAYCILKMGWPLAAAIPACFATGICCGALNGIVIVRWALPSFIVTLGMLQIARGATLFVTDSRTLYIGQSIETISATIPGLGVVNMRFFSRRSGPLRLKFYPSSNNFSRRWHP